MKKIYNWLFANYKITDKPGLVATVFLTLAISYFSIQTHDLFLWSYPIILFSLSRSIKRDWSNQKERYHYRLSTNYYICEPIIFCLSIPVLLTGVIYWLMLPNFSLSTVTAMMTVINTLIYGTVTLFTSIRRLQPKK
ncbi:hypothetical protein R4Y45_05520 [Holzapfeliella sp. He02]|uniref:Uncharacterized protein n=1 Tax=Holzapfeliella saturejae TaxID=3082953 RepID=A0ABU8SH70_9LACO